MRVTQLSRILRGGEWLPRGYGVAWQLPTECAYICYPVPFNRIAATFRAWWIDLTMPVGDDRLTAAYRAGRHDGYEEGRLVGERRCLTEAQDQLARVST